MRLGKKILMAHSFALAIATFAVLLIPNDAQAYTQSRLIDNAIFDNSGSMNEAQIQSFLVSKGSCLATYRDIDPTWNGTQWTYTGDASAAYTIAKVSNTWGINPQVILATLQKEQSLISGKGCVAPQINSAMGYDCPDSGGLYNYPNSNVYGTCVKNEKNVGFARQVLWGSWQLKFGRERSEGNTAWNGDGGITYVGYMTQGTFKRCASSSCPPVYNSGDATIDGQLIHLDNGSTASLYSYTPHLNQSFPSIFASYFGAPTSDSSMYQALYRLYQSKTDRHFYTLNISERDTAIKNGFKLEGTAYYVSYGSSNGLTPIYRLYNSRMNYHFYTISIAERDRATGVGFTYEGIGFYAGTSSANNAVPVYRLLNTVSGRHLFTINPAERDSAVKSGYRYEGISYYAGLGN